MDKIQKFLAELASGNVKKHELKDFIHANWFFSQAMMNVMNKDDASKSLTKDWGSQSITFNDSIPEGENIFIYEGIISQQYGKGEKNRNGYKIDKNWWKFDEYSFNTAILLMHDMEKGVIGNMIKIGVVKEGLKWMFRIDINNISDEGIRNQIKTGTLKASSTGSTVEEYMFEDTETGKNYDEGKAIETYWEREVFLAYFGMSDKIILNITSSTMIETSLVSIWSNYKAVHSDTMSKYFTNLISNRMTPEQIEKLKNNNATDTSVENKEGETPEGTEAPTTDDTAVTPETTVEGETASESTEEKTSENDVSPEGQSQAPADIEGKGEEVQTDSLKAEVEALRQENAYLKNQINTPVINTSVAYSDSKEEKKENEVSPKLKEASFVSNMRNAKV